MWLLDFCSSHKAGKSNWQEQWQAWELNIVYAWGFQLSLAQKIVHTRIVLSNGVLCCHQSHCPQITFEHDQNMVQSMYVPLVQDHILYSKPTLTSFLSLCLASKIKHKVIPSWSSLKFSVTLSTYNKSTQIYWSQTHRAAMYCKYMYTLEQTDRWGKSGERNTMINGDSLYFSILKKSSVSIIIIFTYVHSFNTFSQKLKSIRM